MGKKIKLFSKRIIAKLFKIFGISSLISAFGGISCSLGFPREGIALYGVPGNFFSLQGNVTDSNGNPIKGIEISVKADTSSPSKGDYDPLDDENTKTYLETSKTDENGDYSLYWNCMNDNYVDFILDIKDVDGEENGSFNDATETVNYKHNDYKDKTDFGNPIYEITGKNIKLNKKTELK